MAKIAENTEVDIPEELVEDEINHMIKHFEEQIKMQGISLDVFFEMTKSNEEALREQMKEEAEKHVLYRFSDRGKVCRLDFSVIKCYFVETPEGFFPADE